MPAIFLSYAHADAEKALRLHNDLTQAGVDVWLDQESLLPGQRWKPAIENAIRSTRYFVALLSTASVSRRGYVQKELVIALDVLDEFPSQDIFVIPARLEDCSPSHPKLRDLHWVDLYPDWDRGVAKILRAVGAPVEPAWKPDPSNPVEPRGSEPPERAPPAGRRYPNPSDPIQQHASGERPPSSRSEPSWNKDHRRRVRTLLRGVRVLFLGFALVFLLPTVCYVFWLFSWQDIFSPDRPISPAITTVFVIGEFALAMLAGWTVARFSVRSPRVGTAIAASGCLVTWVFLGWSSSPGTAGAPYVGMVTIAGPIYVIIGGRVLSRGRREVLKSLGIMVALGVLLPAFVWLPKALAPPPPYERQEVFSLPNLNSIAISPDGSQFATISRADSLTHAVMLWNRQPRTLQHSVSMPSSRIRILRFSADGRRLVAVGDSGVSCFLFSCLGYTVARTWDVRTGRVGAAVNDPDGSLSSTISPDGAILATRGRSAVRLWATATGERLREFRVSTQLVELSPGGQTLAMIPDSASVSLWDIATGRLLKTMPARSPVTALAFSPDRLVLATGAHDGSVSMWDARTGTLKKRILADTTLGPIRGLVFSPDGRWLASTSDGGIAVLWRVADETSWARWDAGFIAFVPDHKSVVTHYGPAFALWDAYSLKWKQSIVAQQGIFGPMPSIEFSANGAVLVTRRDTTVSIWLHRARAPHQQGK